VNKAIDAGSWKSVTTAKYPPVAPTMPNNFPKIYTNIPIKAPEIRYIAVKGSLLWARKYTEKQIDMKYIRLAAKKSARGIGERIRTANGYFR
jgi:hypothetical protein